MTCTIVITWFKDRVDYTLYVKMHNGQAILIQTSSHHLIIKIRYNAFYKYIC